VYAADFPGKSAERIIKIQNPNLWYFVHLAHLLLFRSSQSSAESKFCKSFVNHFHLTFLSSSIVIRLTFHIYHAFRTCSYSCDPGSHYLRITFANNATHSECTLDVYPIHNVRSIHDVPKIEPSPKIGAYSLQARNASFETNTRLIESRSDVLRFRDGMAKCSGNSWMSVSKYDWYAQVFCEELSSRHIAERFSSSNSYQDYDTDGKVSHIICKR